MRVAAGAISARCSPKNREVSPSSISTVMKSAIGSAAVTYRKSVMNVAPSLPTSTSPFDPA